MDDKIYAYELDANGVPQRCFIASNEDFIPNEYTFLHDEPLPITCTIEGGKVIVPTVPAVEEVVWNDTGNDAYNFANDTITLGNDE